MKIIGKCPICGRNMLDDKSTNKHHLKPKQTGGKKTINLHKICHDKIHSVFANRELEKHFNTIEKIIENDQMKKFIKWVKKKPIDFYVGHKDTKRRNKKRKYHR